MKLRLKYWLKKARNYHLRDAIRYRWNTQRSRSPVAFGNVDATYRRREVAARCETIPELV